MTLSIQLLTDTHSVMESMIKALDQSSSETQECVKSLEVATDGFRNNATNVNEKLNAENMKLQALVIELQGQQKAIASTHADEVKALATRVAMMSVESDIQRSTNELLQQKVNLLTTENLELKAQVSHYNRPKLSFEERMKRRFL